MTGDDVTVAAGVLGSTVPAGAAAHAPTMRPAATIDSSFVGRTSDLQSGK
jgi:hypothetical protein